MNKTAGYFCLEISGQTIQEASLKFDEAKSGLYGAFATMNLMYWVWVVFFLIGAAAVYGFFVWHSISRSIEISKPLIAKAKAHEQHPTNPTMRILIAGDSLGVGVGAPSNKESLAGRIGKNFPSADIENISKSGARLADLEAQLIAQEDSKYDLVFITIGGNDITHRTDFNEMRASLTRVLAKGEIIGEKVLVLTAGNVGLCPAFKWPFSSYITYRTREVRKIFIEEIAKYPNASYVDLFKERKDEIFNTDIPRYYAPDLFHPSGEGYGVWFEQLKKKL